jgi:hypothetical protein
MYKIVHVFHLEFLNCLKLFLLYYIKKNLFIFILFNLFLKNAKKEIVCIDLGSGKSKERREIHHCKWHEAKRLLLTYNRRLRIPSQDYHRPRACVE